MRNSMYILCFIGSVLCTSVHAEVAKSVSVADDICEQYHTTYTEVMTARDAIHNFEYIVDGTKKLVNDIPKEKIGSHAALAATANVHHKALLKLAKQWQEFETAAAKVAALEAKLMETETGCKRL